jgi:3-hydroxy-3-methylglutaryl CoA synthase
MHILNFTVEEINLIAMYKADTLAATLTGIDEALPDMYDEDIISIAESASRKLSALTEEDFSALSFTPDGDIDEYE